MTGRNPSISLVITVYRQAEFLEKILYSLINQDFSDYEVLIADDGSGPDVKEVVDRARGWIDQPIRHIWHEDRGFRRARISNRAVAESNGDYLVFIDGDCIPHHRFLSRHFKRGRKRTLLAGRRVKFDNELSKRTNFEAIQSQRIE
jgi:glycosyltransferase involved in cell wall biosynthesis